MLILCVHAWKRLRQAEGRKSDMGGIYSLQLLERVPCRLHLNLLSVLPQAPFGPTVFEYFVTDFVAGLGKQLLPL